MLMLFVNVSEQNVEYWSIIRLYSVNYYSTVILGIE